MTVGEAITALRKPGKAYLYVDIAHGYPKWVEVVKSDLITKLKTMPSEALIKLHLDGQEPKP